MNNSNYHYQQQFHRVDIGSQAPNMSSQRFCLRWNNHQSNLLSVFDQLLHDESFVDVTLAVEGQLLKAHKMVLSACSPYFQTLFVNHPDKHPIVILKDVPYSDMRCLLDFMYRGEVSVDQDRLTAFLRVAESLRIKGLTEVNEEKCDNIASSLTQNNIPNLQRLQQVKRFGNNLNMLGNALLQPKRKRGRPRKLSGSSNPGDDYRDNLVQGSPEHLEVRMGMDGFAGNNSDSSTGKTDKDNDYDDGRVKEEIEPVAGTSKEDDGSKTPENDFHSFEECSYQENNQNHSNLLSEVTVEVIPIVKQETVIISTEVARNMLQDTMEVTIEETYDKTMESQTGIHFLTDDDNTTSGQNETCENYEKKKNELLEYFIQADGSAVCKLCGEVLASRTHWYRHKYKVHVNSLIHPAPLFKCCHCNAFFKSRKGYMGHYAARHSSTSSDNNTTEPSSSIEEFDISNVKEEIVEPETKNVTGKKKEKSVNWDEQRVKEEKLVADIIDRVRKECEAQGAAVTRRGYSRRSTVMNSCH